MLGRAVVPIIPFMLAACDTLAPAPLPDHALALAAPPPQYQTWWARTEACAGVNGRFNAIRWFTVPWAVSFPTPEGEQVGRWTRDGGGPRIVIAGEYLADEMVVRHEMLHELLGRGDHPAEFFVARCHLTWSSWSG